MKKIENSKFLRWNKRDYVWNVVTYFINALIFIALYAGIVYMERRGSGAAFFDFLKDTTDLLCFTVSIVFVFASMILYLAFEDKNFLKNAANSEMIFLVIELSVVVCFVSGRYLSLYFRPFGFAALLILFLCNSRFAAFVDTIFCVCMFLFDAFTGASGLSGDFQFAVTMLAISMSSGFAAIYAAKNVYSRAKLLVVSFVASVPSVICVFLPFVSFGEEHLLVSLTFALVSGPFSAACCMVVLPVLEAIFKRVSCFKYAELTDHKAKFIKKMIEQAPGTFNHSMVVSNVAEACATAIGEDSMLARTCAYYHDIGKLRRPEFFKENQSDGVNPHDDLTPELSANIIRSHTRDGYQLVLKNRLPQEIADVCLEHHGTMPILYFYDKAKKFTDGEVDASQYCYQGPKPHSKIAAILMIADSAEAATRALKERSREKVYEVIKKIVGERMQLGQFDECEITLKELDIIINAAVNCLTGVYHNRIEYPKVDIDKIEGQLTGDEA